MTVSVTTGAASVLVSGTVVAIAVSVAVVVGAVRAGRVTVGVVRVMSADVATELAAARRDCKRGKEAGARDSGELQAATYGRSGTNAEYLARCALARRTG